MSTKPTVARAKKNDSQVATHKVKKKRGPPPWWTPEQKLQIVKEISDRVASGSSVKSLLKTESTEKKDNWPSVFVFWSKWMREPELYAIYDEACKQRVEVFADDVAAIVEQQPRMYSSDTCGPRVDPGWVNWQREIVDIKLRIAGAMRPKRWGKLVQVEGSVSASDLRSAVADIDRATVGSRDDD